MSIRAIGQANGNVVQTIASKLCSLADKVGKIARAILSTLRTTVQRAWGYITLEGSGATSAPNLVNSERILQEWVDAASPQFRSDYEEAQCRILTFLKNSRPLPVGTEILAWNNLSLERLSIESLPEGISDHPAFQNLRVLCLEKCKSLRTVPVNFLSQCTALKSFDCSQCLQLTQVPDFSPCTALERFCCSQCPQLPQLPDFSQCTALKSFYCYQCPRLPQLPDLSRCTALESFYCSDCPRLPQLPDFSRCTVLESFSCSQCPSLTQLSDFSQCTALKSFICYGCTALTQVPDFSRCRALKRLDLVGCIGLTGLPDSIARLARTCMIDITNCRFSDHVLENLRQMVGGPTISYSQTHQHPIEEAPSLDESLHFVYEKAEEAPCLQFRLLKETTPEDVFRKEHLRNWLHRLRWTAEGGAREIKRSQAFYRKVVHNIDLAESSPEFRPIFWANVEEGCTTCGDRVSLSLLKMGFGRERLGLKDQSLKAVWGVLKRAWAIDLLEECAREKVSTLPFFDEVEVYLGYPIQLNKRLGLALDVEKMLFYGCSCLSNQDLLAAEECVKAHWKSQEAAVSYLIRQPEWIDALEKNDPDNMKGFKSLQIGGNMSEEEATKTYQDRQDVLRRVTLLAFEDLQLLLR